MRKTAIQVALVVAGLGLLFAPSLFGSNMGFKLERNLNQVAGSQSFYVMSFPFYRSFNDLWETGVGLGTDGLVQSDDVLADWFTNGDGSCDGGWECVGAITLMYFDNNCPGGTCNQFVFQTIGPDAFPPYAPVMTGVPFPVMDTAGAEPRQGFVAQITAADANGDGIPDPGAFPVIIVGSENPDVVSFRVDKVASQSFYPFSMLYHTTWTTSREVLQAAWDNQDPADTNCSLSLTFMDYDNNCPASPTCNQWVFQSVTGNAFDPCGQPPDFTGTEFNLVPGNGYMFQVVTSWSDIPLPHY